MNRPPKDGIRAVSEGAAVTGNHFVSHFARFGVWNEINSATEGRFLERIEPGAFAKTLSDQGNRLRMLFQHGKDPTIGDQPIGVPEESGEDEIGPYVSGSLLDGIPPLIRSGLDAGQYGVSYRFQVVREDWNDKATRSEDNPDGLPTRTIREAKVFEFGPVTFPADAGADISFRSMTDEFTFATLTADPDRLRALIDAPSAPTPPSGTSEPDAALEPPIVERKDEPPVATQYTSPEDKAARVVELEASFKRTAEENTGVLTVEAQARWDADTIELNELRADLAAHNQRLAFVGSLSDDPKHTYTAPTIIRKATVDNIYNPDQFSGIGFRSIDERNQVIRDNAMRSLDGARIQNDELAKLAASENDVDEKSGLPALASRMIATGSPAYRRAFAKYVKSGNDHGLTNEERAALAVVGTTTAGGYAVPYVFDPSVIRIGTWTPQNPFRAACEVKTITSGNNWRGVTATAITAAYATEALANSEGNPTWGQPTYTVQRAQAFVTLSIEALEDRPDFVGELTANFGDAKDTLEENKFAVGAGTTVYPLGMFTDTAYTNQDTATNDVTALLDFTVVEGAVPLRFRKNAAWFMNRSTIRQLQILDTSYRYFSGAAIQYPGSNSAAPSPQTTLTGNTGLQLLGYPVWEVPSAVSTLTTDGAIIAVLCDPKTYIIVDRIGMNVEVIPNMLDGATPSFPTGQRGVYAYWRNTAKPLTAVGGISLSVQ